MLLYKDVLKNDGAEGDELITDAFKMKLVDDVIYEVDCQMVKVKKGVEVDIGANASAEEAEETLEEGEEMVNNVVAAMRLQSTSFDKKSYLAALKKYMKDIKEHLKSINAPEAEITTFEKGAQAYAKKVVGNFKDYEFYTGENMNPVGMVVLLNYREDGVTPYLCFWKHGLAEIKL